MFYPTRYKIPMGAVFLIIGFTIILGVLLMLDLHRPWQWPWLFGVVWLLVIINGPILIILGTRFMIIGYLERLHFPIPPQPVYPRVVQEAPVQLKPQLSECPHCNKQIVLDSRYCSYCGKEV